MFYDKNICSPFIFDPSFFMRQFLISYFFLLMLGSASLFDFSFWGTWVSLGYSLGLDQLSYLMCFLSFWICSLMLLARGSVYSLRNYQGVFELLIVLLLVSLILALSSLDL